MPRRIILSAAEREVFETLPSGQTELAKHYLLSDEDLELVRAVAAKRIDSALPCSFV